jgi:hypothetical protein
MKLFKEQLLGNTDASISINQNYRISFGYADNSITVKVEKIIKPDLTRIEELDAEVIPQITFETVDEKTFTASDFPKQSDHIVWYVDFDVTTQSITKPKQLLDLFNGSGPSTPIYQIWSTYMSIHNSDLLQLFTLQNFDRLSEGFEKSVLRVFVDVDNTPDLLDTVITAGDFETVTATEYNDWAGANLVPKITFDIKNEQNEDVDATLTARTEQQRFGHYRVSLPAAIYNIQVNVNKPAYSTLNNRYDLTAVNGIINKNRIDINTGSVSIQLNLTGLQAGENAKLKLNLGKHNSFGELWVDIV